MALLKEITHKGIICNYHKVWSSDVVFNTPSPNEDSYVSMTVKVALYKDEAQRVGDVNHYLRLQQYHFLLTDAIAPNNEKLEKIYKALKKLDEYKEAEDV